MKKSGLAMPLLLLLCSACTQPAPDRGAALGEPLTLTDTTAIDAILLEPQTFVGRSVLVSGEILEVCPSKGCWVDLAASGEQKIRVKVQDDVIVFPQESVGKRAIVQGAVEKLELTKEQTIAWREHEAEERGQSFDPASVETGETIFRIQGTGAIVLN